MGKLTRQRITKQINHHITNRSVLCELFHPGAFSSCQPYSTLASLASQYIRPRTFSNKHQSHHGNTTLMLPSLNITGALETRRHTSYPLVLLGAERSFWNIHDFTSTQYLKHPFRVLGGRHHTHDQPFTSRIVSGAGETIDPSSPFFQPGETSSQNQTTSFETTLRHRIWLAKLER